MARVILDVETDPPSFARFLFDEREKLGLEAQDCNTSKGRYFLNDGRVFRVRTNWMGGVYTTIVYVPSYKSSDKVPDWLRVILDRYENTLGIWPSDKSQTVRVQFVYPEVYD